LEEKIQEGNMNQWDKSHLLESNELVPYPTPEIISRFNRSGLQDKRDSEFGTGAIYGA
jgi:hypothetical protein